ncbi:hypothetical protein IMZ48_16440 [Candidatus Bathyarchaeota archaeon]|nr:hypothetical protein [Candidatus Bathyarchaeota archaeon]
MSMSQSSSDWWTETPGTRRMNSWALAREVWPSRHWRKTGWVGVSGVHHDVTVGNV